jgi:hypothetical protein
VFFGNYHYTDHRRHISIKSQNDIGIKGTWYIEKIFNFHYIIAGAGLASAMTPLIQYFLNRYRNPSR